MTPRLLAFSIGGLILLAVIAYFALHSFGDGSDGERIAAADVDHGRAVYDENCAACHGADLKGEPGLDWRRRKADGTFPAPPHDETGHTWHHPDGQLVLMIERGGQALLGEDGVSGMPGFGDILSQGDIDSVLAYIKTSWPENIRSRQAEISALYGN